MIDEVVQLIFVDFTKRRGFTNNMWCMVDNMISTIPL